MQYTLYHSLKKDLSITTLSSNSFNTFWPFNFGIRRNDDHVIIFAWTRFLGGLRLQLHHLDAKTDKPISDFRLFPG
jgi:hypothetical protein